jgi:siroheme synthase
VDTIIVLMGARRLREIAEEFMNAGLEGTRPVAAIESATMDDQRTLIFTIEQAARGLLESEIQSPTLIVIGEVAALAKKLRWNNHTLIDYLTRVAIQVTT